MENALSQRRAMAGWLAAIVGMAMFSGCAQPTAGPERVAAKRSAEIDAINRDPVGYLRRLHERCDALTQYRLKFYRQERLGLIPSLGEMEEIDASFRKEPFSVKFEWADPKMPYYESVYVAGQNNNKLLVRERRGMLFAPPQLRTVDVDLPVKLGMAKNPITAFGLANIAYRTLAPFEDEKLKKVMTVNCEGVVDLEPTGRPAYHLVIERPPTEGYRYTRQDFYVDVATGWPAGTNLWLKDGQLDARYRYAAVDTDVELSDQDFQVQPPASQPGKTGTKPTGAQSSRPSQVVR